MIWTIFLTYLACILSTLLKSSDAVSCFQCNSNTDYRCFDLSYAPKTHDFFLPCEDNSLDRSKFCRKMHIKVTMDNGTLHERVVRTCGWKRYEGKRDCYRVADATHEEMVCQCFTDGCNSATFTNSSFFTTLSLLVISISFFALKP